jgi:hypothetical protein
MLESIINRLAILSSTLLLIFIVSLSSIIYRIDALENQRDLQALILLTRVNSVSDLMRLRRAPSTFDAVRIWLANQHADVERARIATREKVLTLLTQESNGPPLLQSGEITSQLFTGKAALATNETTPSIEFSELEVITPPLVTASDQGYLETDSVTSSIDKLHDLARQNTISIAVDVSDSYSKSVPNSVTLKLESIRLSTRQFVIELSEQLRGPSQRPPQRGTAKIDAKTEILQGPSLVQLGIPDFDASISNALTELELDKERLDGLNSRYGFLAVERARDISGESLSEAFRSVDIVGFRFSPERLPFAIIVLSGMFLGMIVANVEVARRRNIRGATIILENPLQLFMNTTVGRVGLWCILPSIGIAVSTQLASLTSSQQWFLFSSTAAVAAMGAWTAFRATPLFSISPDSLAAELKSPSS